MSQTAGTLVQYIISLLSRKIIVPVDYHSRVSEIKRMLENDSTGLIDSLTDFMVESAEVNFSVESNEDSIKEAFNKWFEIVNAPYKGKIPMGINNLASEYYKERWKSSSFLVLKVAEWQKINGFVFPTKMYFLDGESITSKPKDSKYKKLDNYTYYIGDNEEQKLEDGCYFNKPFARWFDEYPVPFLIKRGIYHNYKLLYKIKEHQGNVLDQIIPYLLLVQRGSDTLENLNKSFGDEEFLKIKDQLQDLTDTIKGFDTDKTQKTPTRVTGYDEKFKHLIPDLKTIFDKEITTSTERNILSGLGFIDVVEATSSSRKESVLNPKATIKEIKSGIKGFKNMINLVIFDILQKNDFRYQKLGAPRIILTNSAVTGFMTDKFKERIRQLRDRGTVSEQTAVEVIGEQDFEIEQMRAENEGSEYGIPKPTQYAEIIGEEKPSSTPKKETPGRTDDKTGAEAKEYELSMKTEDLVTSPYDNLRQLPKHLKKTLTLRQRRAWMKIFNRSYYYRLGKTKDKKEAERYAFKVANEKVKNVKRDNKDSKYTQ